jgi:2'-5' RNA ligase
MVRSFVAINLPNDVKEALQRVAEEQRAIMPERSIRWSRVSGIHLTLKFLGDVAESDLPAIKAALAGCCVDHVPFFFSVGGMGCFPNVKRPRVLWVGVTEETGRLTALQRDVEQHLEGLGFAREKRAFHPHLTLGRTRQGLRSSELTRIGEAVASSEVGELGKVHVDKIHLMRSDLRPDGAVYTSLQRVSLGNSDSGAEP